MESEHQKRAEGLHNLICNMLRGIHTREMNNDELQRYMYKTGDALHNLPFKIYGGTALSKNQLIDINNLDPSGDESTWGEWVQEISHYFNQDLPGI